MWPVELARGGVAVNVALRIVEMALAQRRPSCAWVLAASEADCDVLVGADNGRPFALAVHPSNGRPTRSQQGLLATWRKAGASVGVASTVREALMIVAGADGRAS